MFRDTELLNDETSLVHELVTKIKKFRTIMLTNQAYKTGLTEEQLKIFVYYMDNHSK
jgi:hypothetical protein